MAVGKDSILRAQKAGQGETAAEAAKQPEEGTKEQAGAQAEAAQKEAAEEPPAPKRKRAAKAAETEGKPAARKRTAKKTVAGAKKKPVTQKEAAHDAKEPAGAVRLTDEMPYYLL